MIAEETVYAGKDGLRITASKGGNPMNSKVIYLHGGGQTRHSWKRATQEMTAAGYHCISLDLRGHGESEWSADGSYNLDDYVSDLHSVMATLDTPPPALVGASLGGMTALLAAAAREIHPVSALVLVDVVPRMENKGIAEILNFMCAYPKGFASLEEAADAVADYRRENSRPPDIEGLNKNLTMRGNGRYYWHWDPKITATGNGDLSSLDAMTRQMEYAAPGIDIPTLIVRGAMSRVVSLEGVNHLRDMIPHAECVDVSRAGHMVAGDNNDQFNAVVRSFLDRIFSGAP